MKNKNIIPNDINKANLEELEEEIIEEKHRFMKCFSLNLSCLPYLISISKQTPDLPTIFTHQVLELSLTINTKLSTPYKTHFLS